MADPNDIIQQFTQALAALEARLGQSAGNIRGSMDSFNQLRSANVRASQAFSNTAQAMQGLSRSAADARSSEQAKSRFQKTMAGELAELARQVHRGTLTHAEGDQAFQQMIAAVRENSNLTARQRRDLMEQLIVERRRQDSMQRSTVMQERFSDAMQNYGINAVGKSLQGMASAYQGGAVQISNFAGRAGIQGAGLAIQGLGKIIGGLAPALGAVFGPAGFAAGKALGGTVEILGGAAKEILLPVFDVLSTEFNKHLKNFQTMSAAGAVFGDGILGMNKAAANAGITTENLAVVLKNNAEDISKTGLGMAEGTRMIGKVGKELRESGVSQKLAQLGYTAEEITDMVAQNASAMRQGGAGASDQEIATATAAYAKDLRTLQAITGEDVRQREKESKARNNTLAFNQKLMEMEPAERKRIQDAMAQMNQADAKLYREKFMNNGQAFTAESLFYENQVKGAKEVTDEWYRTTMDGAMSIGKVTDGYQQYGAEMAKSIADQKELGFAAELGAGGPLIAKFATNANEVLERMMKFSDPSSIDKIRAEVDLAYSEKVNAVTKTMGNYEIATKSVEAKLNELVGKSGALELFGSYIGVINSTLLKAAESLDVFIGSARNLFISAQENRNNPTPPQTALTHDPMTGMPIPGSAGNPVVVSDPTVAEAIRNGQPRAPGPAAESGTVRAPGLASGGMVDFPVDGSLAVLHGREAVIPLPSGLRPEDLGDIFKTMLAKLDPQDRARSQESLMTNLSEIEKSALDSKISRLSNSDSMMEVLATEMSKLNENMERMVAEARNISTYTERTARGVA